ncbi:MAG: SLAC1 anion channel family protein [Alphaproteobacteria bacterium]|nr:SLAC1 anion channel family protein [Alphaproteobacteria bacterium]
MNAPQAGPVLIHVPVTIFASVMGLAGLGLAWRKANALLGFPAMVSDGVLVLAALAFLASATTYGLKVLRHFPAVVGEFDHPIRSAFFSTIPISMMLMAAALHPHGPAVSFWLWAAGALLQLALTIRLIVRWMVHKQDITHVNPAWFIPIVGNIIVPTLGVSLGQIEISWFFLSIGMVFWLPLMTIILYRLIFHDALPPRLAPTLFILLPPLAVGYLAYVGLVGTVDPFAQVLVNGALFVTLVLLAKTRRFVSLPFALSWWAFTFPLDAVAMAAIQHGRFAPDGMWPTVGLAMLALASLVVGIVTVRTLAAIAKGTLFVPE